jgi:AmmeMemoRadiSam system protein B
MVPSGYGSLLVAMHASKILGAKKGELLKYSTSYKVARDKEDVTGYASIIIS